ncbi:SAM-dependent methyltransferase [Micromonospora cathayae]|uniref:Methyltransferase domain-containing protein n=1 Tax=Micromonospora cathayae TaxID=3028804 RepID=A0ABY7ZKK5_9ACTN|nr:methyltransferase domain-containing protein [Micromonospora sp. HUAS 3]WDZ83485.1 methyltransferase domain-containing protein [Micromonospora sp. HUAS 3]
MDQHGHDAAVIGRHYDERTPIEDAFRNGQTHMWYWYDEQDDTPLPEAVHRMSRKVCETLGLRPGERLLDAGCGPGQTAVYLAQTYGVRVTGVTLSRVEMAAAAARAAANGLADQVRFQLADYMALPFADGSFDAVLALESLQNAPDAAGALRELFRVLRPGGRLSFSDFSLRANDEPERIRKFMTTLKLTELPTLEQWLALTEAAGFEIEEYTQCGPRVFGRKAKYISAASERRAELVAQFGDQALASFSQHGLGFFAPRKSQVGYVVVAARRPHR